MSEVYFYHLTQTPLEQTLPDLLEKSRERDWRVLVRGSDDARLAALSNHLWSYKQDSFLAHGLEGADQPILLSTSADNTNAADVLIVVDGAACQADEVATYQRVSLVFDGNDEAALNAARAAWKTLTDAGLPARYWSQETGRWQQKTTKNLAD